MGDLKVITNWQNQCHTDFLRKNRDFHNQIVGDKNFFKTKRPTAFKKFNVKVVQLKELKEEENNLSIHLSNNSSIFFVVDFTWNEFIRNYSPRIINTIISRTYVSPFLNGYRF